MSLNKQNNENLNVKSQELHSKLEALITNAIAKVGGKKEKDLCKYLSVSAGGYMHHFTLRKMKTEEPEKLSHLIEKFILAVKTPNRVPPKPRAPRGSRQKQGQITLSNNDLERMLSIARLAGDKEMIEKLTPKKSLVQIKKELISSIRQEKAEHSLWNSYVEALSKQVHEPSSPLQQPNSPAGLRIGLNKSF